MNTSIITAPIPIHIINGKQLLTQLYKEHKRIMKGQK